MVLKRGLLILAILDYQKIVIGRVYAGALEVMTTAHFIVRQILLRYATN